MLTQAYGADARRWPLSERAAAQRLIDDGAPEIVRSLADAAKLDDMLARYAIAPPSERLAHRILAAAPRPLEHLRRSFLMWSGAGLAGAGMVGALAGALLVAHLSAATMRSTMADLPYDATAFGEIGEQDEP